MHSGKFYIESTHQAVSTTWIRYRLYFTILLLSAILIALKIHFELPLVKTPFYQTVGRKSSTYNNRYLSPYLDRKVYTLQQKGGFVSLLQSVGISESLIYNIILPIFYRQINVQSLPAQTEIAITMRRGGNLVEPILQSISIAKDHKHDLTITRQNKNHFSFAITPRMLYHKYLIATYGDSGRSQFKSPGTISLDHQIPEAIRVIFSKIMIFSPLMEIIKHKHPNVTILYDVSIDRNNLIASYEHILAIDIQTSNRHQTFYRFLDHDGRVGYYNRNGYIIPELLFHRPVPIMAPISSGFGWRMHPILHHLIKHEGVDFAVPLGTPIRAAAAGIIAMRQHYGGFGLYVRIRHTDDAIGYQTEYAHLSHYAYNLHLGDHVKIGQIIGYSGSSGLSTGPHLHFGLIAHKKRINPLTKILIRKMLEGQDLKTFYKVTKLYDSKLKTLAKKNWSATLEVASAQGGGKVLE